MYWQRINYKFRQKMFHKNFNEFIDLNGCCWSAHQILECIYDAHKCTCQQKGAHSVWAKLVSPRKIDVKTLKTAKRTILLVWCYFDVSRSFGKIIFFEQLLPLMLFFKNLVKLVLILLLRVFFIVETIRACIEGSYSPALRAGQLWKNFFQVIIKLHKNFI